MRVMIAVIFVLILALSADASDHVDVEFVQTLDSLNVELSSTVERLFRASQGEWDEWVAVLGSFCIGLVNTLDVLSAMLLLPPECQTFRTIKAQGLAVSYIKSASEGWDTMVAGIRNRHAMNLAGEIGRILFQVRNLCKKNLPDLYPEG